MPVVPVPHTVINAAGSPPLSFETDLSGNYSLSGFGPGAYTVTPFKANENYISPNGIFSNDASLVAQYVVGLATLNDTQRRAASVSGLPNISSFDASLIAQWVVGISNPINQTGKWAFTLQTAPTPNVNSSLANQDYSALLMGDVNGDWTAPTMRPEGLCPEPIRLALRSVPFPLRPVSSLRCR
jgi:hypothetical protein